MKQTSQPKPIYATPQAINARVRTLKTLRALSQLGCWRSWESIADSAIDTVRRQACPACVRSAILDLRAVSSIIDETPWLYDACRTKVRQYLKEVGHD